MFPTGSWKSRAYIKKSNCIVPFLAIKKNLVVAIKWFSASLKGITLGKRRWILLHKGRYVYHIEFHSGKMYKSQKHLDQACLLLNMLMFLLAKLWNDQILFVLLIYLSFSFKTSWKVCFLINSVSILLVNIGNLWTSPQP